MRGSGRHPPAPPRPPRGRETSPAGPPGHGSHRASAGCWRSPGLPLLPPANPSGAPAAPAARWQPGMRRRCPGFGCLARAAALASPAACGEGSAAPLSLLTRPGASSAPSPPSRSLHCVPPRCSLEPLVQGKLMVGCGQGGAEFIEATRSSCAIRDGAGGSGTSVNPLCPLVPLHPRPQAPPGCCCVTEGCDAGAWQVALPPEPGLLPAQGSSALPFVAAVVNFSGNIGLSP